MASSDIRAPAAAYLFRSPRRLRQAKADLYGYLLTQGLPDPGVTYVADRFRDQVGVDSPLLRALAGWPPDAASARVSEAITFLRRSIYLSELHHGETAFFEQQYAALQQGHRQPVPAVGGVSRGAGTGPARPLTQGPAPRRSLAGRLMRLAGLILCGWALLTGALAWQQVAHGAAARDEARDVYRLGLAGLAVSLPAWYGACQTGECPASGAVHDAARTGLHRALDGTALLISAVSRSAAKAPVAIPLAAMLPTQCGPPGLSAEARTTTALCRVRLRLSDHLLCVTPPPGADPRACAELVTLGVTGTRFERREERGGPRPVNVFNQQLELPQELARALQIADGLPSGVRLDALGRAFRARALAQYAFLSAQIDMFR